MVNKDRNMRIHWLQHVPFEGLGLIAEWIESHNHTVEVTRLYLGETLPDPASIDILIIMGGPMGIYDEEEYPWLADEKQFIRGAIEKKKTILGICLGAQLLADCLGGTVRSNREKEIGWFSITRNSVVKSPIDDLLPNEFSVLHWHGDTFSLPPGATQLYGSAACSNQAFICQNRFLGLQFHLEIDEKALQLLIENCSEELVNARWIQQEPELMEGVYHSSACREVLFKLLEYLKLQATQ